MKNIKTLEELNEAAKLNEGINAEYRVGLSTRKGIIGVTLVLDSLKDAAAVDAWLEEMKDNGIYAADGGPNEIEL